MDVRVQTKLSISVICSLRIDVPLWHLERIGGSGEIPMRKRVLVVDDSPEWHGIIRDVLEPDCAVIGYARDADELAAKARQLLPDVLTLDVSMPGKSGLNALPPIRQMLPDAFIVIVSCCTNPVYKEEAFRRGADAYVLKTRVRSELSSCIAGSQTVAESNFQPSSSALQRDA